MTKKQKIWLGIFVAMFVVPEVLWGGLASTFLNYKPIFDFSQFFRSNQFVIGILVLPQIIALVGLLVLNYKCQKNKTISYIIGVILFLTLIVFLALVYTSYSFSYASFP